MSFSGVAAAAGDRVSASSRETEQVASSPPAQPPVQYPAHLLRAKMGAQTKFCRSSRSNGARWAGGARWVHKQSSVEAFGPMVLLLLEDLVCPRSGPTAALHLGTTRHDQRTTFQEQTTSRDGMCGHVWTMHASAELPNPRDWPADVRRSNKFPDDLRARRALRRQQPVQDARILARGVR